MEKKKELIYHTYRTLYADSIKTAERTYVVAVSGFLYRIKRRLWGLIPLPSKYEDEAFAIVYGYSGDVNELMQNDFSADDQKKVENEIEDAKKTLTDKRKEFTKHKKK